ncbi:hypothetical protein FRC03_001473 [Tulasnella sp. 419]|nr:hypothetical protein FRC03_001473 [Tulasnella sp. 419]
MEKLIAKPLQDVTDGPSTVVIVIDALDECSNEPLVQEMIVLLASTIPKLPFRTRLFITSRPDVHIRSRFNDPALKSVSEASILHDIDIAVVQHDIGLYLDHHLRRIGKEMLGDESWPSQSDIDSLTERAKGLFIYASASIAYIEDKEHREPKERLNRLLDDISDGGESPFADIDKLYRYILNSSLPKRNAQEVAGRLRAILGAIVLLQDPLSSSAMEKLISMSEGSIRPTIIPLHAVLSVPDDVKEPIRVFHQSFPDFMVDYRRCNNPHLIVDPPVHHTHLALHCINLMNLSLCRNMCGLVQDYIIPNADIPNLADILEKNVGSHILYACRFWATHLRQADATNESLRIALSDFVNTKTIYWLEIMSLLGQLDTALTSLHDAMKWYKDLELEPKQLKVVRKLLPVTEKMGLLHQYVQSAERKLTTMHAPIKSLLYDYQRLLLRFYEPMSLSATNIYLSALPFIPHCLLYQQIKGNMLRNSVRINQRETGWGPTLAILQGHSRSINSVCLSPDGTKIASGSNDQTVRVWDSTTGAHIRTLEGHSSWVNFVCFSPDGTKIASGSDDKTVQVWDSATGAHIGTLKGHSHGVSSVWFSPDGTKIASGSYDETVQVWDSTTGAHIKTLKGHSKWVLSVCFSPDGTKIASGSYDQTVQVWDSTTGAHIRTLKGHSNTVNSVCFSPDGTKIASGSDDNTVRVWDSTTGAHIGTLKGHSHGVSSVCFSPDGTKIAFGSYDETVQVWDSTTGAHIRTLKGHSHGVNSVWFSPDGTKIASGSYDQTVRVWDSTTGAHIRSLKGHSNMVNSVCFSPDGTKIASGSYDQTVQVWDSTTGAHIRTLKGHSNTVNSVCFSPDGTKIASGSDDNTVRVWDSTTGAHIGTLKGHSHGVSSVCFSPDGTKIAFGSYDETVQVWDSTTGAHIRTLKGHSHGVNSVWFSPDGTKIASGSYDQTVRVWDSTTGAHIRTLKGHSNMVNSVCFSPDGTKIASGSYDQTVQVWDSTTGAHIRTLKGHSNTVNSVCFSPDGTKIASGSDDNTVRVWDSTTGAHIRTLKGHSHGVSSVCFSPDGTKIASGSDDQTVRVWDSTTGAHIRTLKGHSYGVNSVCFSTDGTKIASGSYDQIVRVWDSTSGDCIKVLHDLHKPVHFVCLSPDGSEMGYVVWKSENGIKLDTFNGGDPGSFHHFSMDESVESFDALYKPKPSGLFFLDKTYVFYHQSEKTKYLICHLPFPNVIQYAFHNHSLALGTTDGVVWILDLYPAVGKLI